MNIWLQAGSYRFLWSGRNLLPHLLCLLLIFSLPAMAQGSTCTGDSVQTKHISAIHNEFEEITHTFCPPPLGHSDYGVKFTGNNHQDPFAGNLDPDLNMKLYQQGASKPSDQRNIYDMGVNPATLSPEALDLDIFPTFEISAELSLIPSLSYAPNHVLSRMGRLNYGPPKQWQNHYGEIVVMIGPTESNRAPVGAPDLGSATPPPPVSDSQRLPVPSELQVFFINASGQQVNFYPDPALIDTTNKPIANHGQVTRWFSEDGTYRLVDLGTTGAFQFELHTSSGLKMAFEPYNFHLDVKQEALTRHFRVTKITDRHNNYVSIGYRDDNANDGGDPNYSGDAVLQPYKVQGHRNGGGTETLLQEITYKYDARNRLYQLELPAYGTTTQTYTFYYLDSGEIQDLPLAEANQVTNRLKLNNVYSQTLTYGDSQVVLPPLKSNLSGYLHLGSPGWPSGLFLNFDSLGFAPEIGIDFEDIFTSGGYSGEFKSAPHRFHVAVGSQTALLVPGGKARQIKSNTVIEPDAIHYRYKIHEDQYPTGVSNNTTPDFVNLVTASAGFSSGGPATISVLPRLKQNDLIAWVDNNTIKINTLNLQGNAPTHLQNGSYKYPVSGSDTPPDTGLYFIRKDQRDRIAEIAYPQVSNSSRKRLLFKYAENSRNHAEIEEILTYDEPSTGTSRLLSQTTYTYEHVLVQTAAEDLAPMVPSSIPENEWRNCARANVPLDPAGTHKVSYGIHRLNRHEVIDMLRHKRVRTYEPGLVKNQVNIPADDYRDLETFYGGSWNFAMLGLGNYNEQNPSDPNAQDTAKTCDVVEWGIAQKPFSFTWQINPDGSSQVYDLSSDGVGLDPVLAYANTGTRVFKTYQFDTAFKNTFSQSDYGHFLGTTSKPYSPYYQYLPKYKILQSHCTSDCAISDLERYPQLDSNRKVPTLPNLFGFSNTKAFAASVELFEPIPMFGYDLLTDIHPNNRLKKITLGSLHGSIQQTGSHTPDRFYYRISALHNINKIAAGNAACEASLIDTYLRGSWTSNVHTENAKYFQNGMEHTVNYTYDVKWNYGGTLGSSSCVQFIHQRQKNHRLRPHAQIQLKNLNGFGWNTAKNILELNQNTNHQSPWAIEASRYSNGGYLGSGGAIATDVAGSNTSQITSANANQSTLPTGLSVGDVFTYDHKVFEITQINSDTYTVKPALASGTITGLKFYRFYNPNVPAQPYLGYDIFGNNAFKATYKRSELLFPHPQDKATGKDHGLVPNFFDQTALPFSLSLNDSTNPANQDTVNWNYFGRVTRQFETGKLTMTYENAQNQLEETPNWQTGMVTDLQYPSSVLAYHWLPVEKVAYFIPSVLNQNLDTLNLASLSGLTTASNSEDFRISYRYYRPPNSNMSHAYDNTNPMSHGRLSLEWSGKSAYHPGQNQWGSTRFEYDTFGWTSLKDQTTFKVSGSGGIANYGTRTQLTSDPVTGWTSEEKAYISENPVWNNSATSPETRSSFTGTNHLRSRTTTQYDILGRQTEVKTYNASDQAFGPIITTSFPSQTHTITVTKQTGEDTSGNPTEVPLNTAMTFTNGSGQTIAQIRQRVGETSAFGTFMAYDAFGRISATSAEIELLNAGTLTTHIETDASAGGHTQTRYNLRGEAFGTVLYNGGAVLQSSWILKTQDTTSGNLTTWAIQQVPDENVTATNTPKFLNLKAMTLNADGLLSEVADYRNDTASTLWSNQTEATLKTAINALTGPQLLAKALYTYDRLGNITEAKLGTDANQKQTRTFRFDQRGRLRTEEHPEMGDHNGSVIVAYTNFDHFENPLTVTHNQGGLSKRTWTSTYDTAGNLLTYTAGTNVMDYAYNYHNVFGSTGPSAFPEHPRAIRHRDSQSGTFLYRHDYDTNTGLLTKRSFFHNQFDFPGKATGIDNANLIQVSPQVASDAIEVSYSYDAMGRITGMTYPDKVMNLANYNPTSLEFKYGAHGLLTQVDDLTSNLTLMKSLTYGVGDQLEGVDFATPITAVKNRLLHTYDPLNRIATWKAILGLSSGIQAGSDDHTRQYHYDIGGRISKISETYNTSVNENGYRYAYDGLKQIAQADYLDAGGTTTWKYDYDQYGFGNLTSFKENNAEKLDSIDLTNNQIDQDAVYTVLGELKQFKDENQTTLHMTYNDLGRMITLEHSPNSSLSSKYNYDHAGMRVFNETKGTHPGLDQARTLYFYDANGMILCEWVSEKAGANWSSPHWDKTYVYLAGKSSITYEYDATDSSQNGGQSLPAGPLITNTTFINSPVFSWEDLGPGPYHLEIKNPQGQLVAKVEQIQTPSWTHRMLKYGKYQVRARKHNQAWGAWKTVYFMDSASQEKVGIYGLDWQENDQSYFKNHMVPSGSIHYVTGKNESGLYLNSGETLKIPTPHNNLQGSFASTSFWVKPDVDSSSEEVGPDRDLWTLGSMRLTINKTGQLKVKWPGSSGSQPSVNLTGQTWQHLVIVYGNSTLKIYLDNVLSFNLTNVPTTNLTTVDMVWGHANPSIGAASGIDEVRCFDRALTNTEINNEYTRWD